MNDLVNNDLSNESNLNGIYKGEKQWDDFMPGKLRK